MPTDVSSEEILEIVARLKAAGAIIVSCYVTNKDVAKPRCLHGIYEESWDEGAKLMFNCASIALTTSSFYAYFKELNWEIQKKGRLFAQINETDFLEEFLKVIVSPLTEQNKNIP